MKDRILNIGIIVLVIACLILGGRLLYNNYMDECEAYNQNIVDFTVEMIKGNKSLEDIDTLDANDSVKESLRKYYNDTFYLDDYLLLSYDYKYIDEIIEECENFYRQSTVNGVFDEQKYNSLIMSASEKRSAEYYKNLSEEAKLDSFVSFEDDYYQYNREYKDINDFEIKDGQLSILFSNLSFNDGKCITYYKGYRINIYRDALDKKIRDEVKMSEKYQSISMVNMIEGEDFVECVVKDYLSNNYSFNYSTKLWKINEIIF